MTRDIQSGLQCPLPLSDYPNVLLAHGGGGRLMHQLIDLVFAAAFTGPELDIEHDGATLAPQQGRLVFTTDSYVVHPLFFPGGDIGSLAVYGTINDLAMCGARPKYLSAGFILEEGLRVARLWEIVQSMRRAADAGGVKIVTGDTKVVDRGRGDGLYINTAGIGVAEHNLVIGPRSIRPGDSIILSGDIGRHGIAIMAEREGLSFETRIESDCASLAGPVLRLLEAGIEIRCLRDLTRGGLATALVEISRASGQHILIDGNTIPVLEEVKGACEILGFDPLYVANEGRFVVFVPEHQTERVISELQAAMPELTAVLIGRVTDQGSGRVSMISAIGSERILDMLSGEQLPRIC